MKKVIIICIYKSNKKIFFLTFITSIIQQDQKDLRQPKVISTVDPPIWYQEQPWSIKSPQASNFEK